MEQVLPWAVKMDGYEKEQCIDAIRAELPSFAELDVFDQVMQEDITTMRRKGIHSSQEIACKIDP
eukprot:5537516-Prorocentrum_lima.AAC.1